MSPWLAIQKQIWAEQDTIRATAEKIKADTLNLMAKINADCTMNLDTLRGCYARISELEAAMRAEAAKEGVKLPERKTG